MLLLMMAIKMKKKFIMKQSTVHFLIQAIQLSRISNSLLTEIRPHRKIWKLACNHLLKQPLTMLTLVYVKHIENNKQIILFM